MTPMMALLLTWNTPDEQTPTGVYAEERLIIAWRVDSFGAAPIISGDHPASNQEAFIIHQDGKCELPFMGTFDSKEKAIQHVVAEERWKQAT